MPNRWVTSLLAMVLLLPPAAAGVAPGTRRRHLPHQRARCRGRGARRPAVAVHGGEPRHQGRPAGDARRGRPEAPALRAVAQRRAPAIPTFSSSTSIWTPEFAAAGWILPLDRFRPDTAAFFPADHRRQPLAGQPVRAALVRRRRDAVLAHRPHGGAARDLRRAGSAGRARQADERRPLRAGVAGRALRRAGDDLPRVSRRLRRPHSRRRAGGGELGGRAAGR